jgi:hypothetical protein
MLRISQHSVWFINIASWNQRILREQNLFWIDLWSECLKWRRWRGEVASLWKIHPIGFSQVRWGGFWVKPPAEVGISSSAFHALGNRWIVCQCRTECGIFWQAAWYFEVVRRREKKLKALSGKEGAKEDFKWNLKVETEYREICASIWQPKFRRHWIFLSPIWSSRLSARGEVIRRCHIYKPD